MPSSLEQQRRAAGTAMTARRGTGDQMAARRNGRKAVEDINSLVSLPSQRKSLTALDPRGRLEAKQGRGDYVEPITAGAGIASPLTEAAYADREYWAEKTITSSDGLLSFRIKPIKKIIQADANDAEVVQLFADPNPVPAP
jgi:hypothetical protein